MSAATLGGSEEWLRSSDSRAASRLQNRTSLISAFSCWRSSNKVPVWLLKMSAALSAKSLTPICQMGSVGNRYASHHHAT